MKVIWSYWSIWTLVQAQTPSDLYASTAGAISPKTLSNSLFALNPLLAFVPCCRTSVQASQGNPRWKSFEFAFINQPRSNAVLLFLVFLSTIPLYHSPLVLSLKTSLWPYSCSLLRPRPLIEHQTVFSFCSTCLSHALSVTPFHAP